MRKLYAIFGNPVSHSKSPLMHNLCFKEFGLHSCYTRVKLEDGTKLKEMLLSLGINGANITVPHKEAAFRACDWVDDEAKDIGAINTIINDGGILKGYNTDAPGFMMAVKEFAKQKVLIFGAGGTAKAIATIMHKSGLEVTVLNRSKNRLKDFDFCKCYDWESFDVGSYDLLINTTSAGLNDNHLPANKALLQELMQGCSAVVDVIYGKETPFLTLAKSYNLKTKDGTDMLLYQGVLAFELFTHNNFSQDLITQTMKRALAL